MKDVLGRIEAVLDGLCPCGAEPTAGSAYCGPDCTPTHISVHTDQRETGEFATPMRWRPDLVTAVDDAGLCRVDSEGGYAGPYNPTVYERTDRDQWHLRLDDGHRWVGLDLAKEAEGVELLNQMAAAWRRLERELGNRRRSEPESEDPWAGVWSRMRELAERHGAECNRMVFGTAGGSARPAGTPPDSIADWIDRGTTMTDGVVVACGNYEGVVLHLQSLYPIRLEDSDGMLRATQALAHRMEALADSLRPAFERVQRLLSEAARTLPAEPEHPMLRAIEQRRNRNTGPEQRQRAPRQIRPRRGR